MKKKKLTIVSLIVLVILAVFIFIIYGQSSHKNTISNNSKISDDQLNNSAYIENTYFRVMSSYGVGDNPGFFDMFNTDNSLERLKLLNDNLNEEFNFFEFYTQPLYYEGHYNGDKKFVEGTEFGDDCINQEIVNSLGATVTTTPLKTFMMGKLHSDKLKDFIEDGRNFDVNDYTINNPNEEISIILGNEYKNIYQINDKLTLSLHEKQLNLKVIGFFKKNTKIKYQNSEFIFDKSILIPFYDITYKPSDKLDEVYQKLYYSQKNEGLIKINEDSTNDIEIVKANYLNKVEELANNYDLLYSIPSSPVYIKFPNNNISQEN